MDLEILQSRFDSLQSLISTHNDLLTGADDLVNEVTRMRLELEEEKAKTFMLEQQIKILSEEVIKSKPDIRQALPTKNTARSWRLIIPSKFQQLAKTMVYKQIKT